MFTVKEKRVAASFGNGDQGQETKHFLFSFLGLLAVCICISCFETRHTDSTLSESTM